MEKDTLTLVIDGDVELQDFSEALVGFFKLVSALQKHVAKGHDIKWTIEALEASSAIATVRGAVSNLDDAPFIPMVVDAYEKTGEALSTGAAIPFPKVVEKQAKNIAKVIGTSVTGIRFETAELDAQIEASVLVPSPAEPYSPSVGEITGRIQSMTNRRGLRFTLYDLETDKAVSCYLQSGMEDEMRNAWGKLATVAGMVHRNRDGRATSVRGVSSVLVEHTEDDLHYTAAFGAMPIAPGEELPEDAIRRSRDARGD